MSKLSYNFFLFLSILVLSFFFIILKPNLNEDTRTKNIQNISKLTKLPGLALSFPYLENNILYYEDFSNNIFLNIPPYQYSDFVYEK